jgi:hypothetical protein
MRVLTRERVRWAALLAIVGALAVGGVAYATIPGPGGVISGCYKKSGGALRVIDSSVTNCASNETSLPWNQAGLQGPPGPPGPTEGVAAVPSGANGTLPQTLDDQFGFAPETESTFTTTVDGKLYLSKPFNGNMECDGSLSVWWWIKLDGVDVRSSLALAFVTTDNEPYLLVGVTDSVVAAGTHTMTIAGMCSSGNPTGAGLSGGSAGTAIVLG